MDPTPECPYCGADTPRRPVRLALRWLSVLLILAGFLGILGS
jgi:hypothetical protein